jgi:hypothetical protein
LPIQNKQLQPTFFAPTESFRSILLHHNIT